MTLFSFTLEISVTIGFTIVFTVVILLSKLIKLRKRATRRKVAR